jgi:hypothetical protein
VYRIPDINHTSTGSQTITHCTTSGTHEVGFGNKLQFNVASGYAPAMLKEHIGKTVREFEIGLYRTYGILEAKLCIWNMAPIRMNGVSTLLYEQNIPVSDLHNEINLITLNKPWLIDGRYLYIGVSFTLMWDGVFILLDDTPVAQCNPLGRLQKTDLGWESLPNTYSDGTPLNGVWNMNIIVDGTPIKSRMTLDHTTSLLQPNTNKDLTITFGAEDIVENCVKTAQLYFYSNDFNKEKTIIDVTANFTTGIEELTMNNEQLTIYPNPTSGELHVTCHSSLVTNVEVFDVYGRKQKAESRKQSHLSLVTCHETVVDISELPAGVYFVRIVTEQGIVMRKVVKR